MSEAANWALIATLTEERATGFLSVVEEVGLAGRVYTDVEQLLYDTRGENVPSALILDHGLTERVPNLELVTILRRRKGFEEIPFVYLGPPNAELQTRVVEVGADAYITLPTRQSVVKAHLSRLLERRRAESAMRKAFEEARRFEQAYKESERMKDDLIHMLVHDLKSPISSVMGLLDHSLEMLSGQGGDATVEDLLSLARSESQHLLNLAANILDVRRMKEGHMPYHPETIPSLTELAKAALGDVSGGPRDRHFGFLVRPEAERVIGDPKLLRRILANLMANAIKHTRRGGYIDFRAWVKDDNAVLSVRDDGEGIPESDQKRIFNAFEQSRHTIHDRYDSGMGLTFCKLAVEKHGGRIWVESKIGRGSTFYFTLPAQVADVIPAGA
ncbi:MAG: HAMP domain-containing sensor histidine kinase [Trueperaceae bacterium]|jgi:signal transduction histidine kinase|nr:HAMP domain-containing sensor histidine kinase [Truepera sp.]HRN18830.1 HAMP domain-containing sensor histidine kinase [Trueperaceae bacterium]HRQ10617.1 HAMP domain-containing sensor histidine kinase [Trueperaceae bacterium]